MHRLSTKVICTIVMQYTANHNVPKTVHKISCCHQKSKCHIHITIAQGSDAKLRFYESEQRQNYIDAATEV